MWSIQNTWSYVCILHYFTTFSLISVSAVRCLKGRLSNSDLSETFDHCRGRHCFVRYRKLRMDGPYHPIEVGCMRHCREHIGYLTVQTCCNRNRCNQPIPSHSGNWSFNICMQTCDCPSHNIIVNDPPTIVLFPVPFPAHLFDHKTLCWHGLYHKALLHPTHRHCTGGLHSVHTCTNAD